MSALIRYDAACRALAEAKAVDEVKDIRDKAEALRAYARVAKNRHLEIDAAEIRVRAERRLGELLTAQKETFGFASGGQPYQANSTPTKTEGVERPTLAEAGIDYKLSSRSQKLAAVPEPEFEAKLAGWRDKVQASDERILTPVGLSALAAFSGNNEWYTPAIYIDAAREVMGGIDLDPATSAMAQKTVQASMAYMQEDDGLGRKWRGRVWLNPPYAAGLIDRFVKKLVDEFRAGNVTEAVVLVDNRTDTGWFHLLASVCSRLCFTRGRVNFYNENTNSSSPGNGSTFFYLGDNPGAFEKVFARFGLGGPVTFAHEAANGIGQGAQARERFAPLDERRALILTPSTYPGFTFVTVVDIDTGVAEGFTRPMRDDAISSVVVSVFDAPGWPTSWTSKRSAEHSTNPWLEGPLQVPSDFPEAPA